MIADIPPPPHMVLLLLQYLCVLESTLLASKKSHCGFMGTLRYSSQSQRCATIELVGDSLKLADVVMSSTYISATNMQWVACPSSVHAHHGFELYLGTFTDQLAQ